MRTGRGFERLVNFTDAVIAIALTLLVLPLVEIPQELTDGGSVGDLFSRHRDEFGAFVLSFVVIWSLWRSHHHMIEYFKGYDAVLLRLHMLWLFTLVTLPFSTQLLSAETSGQGGVPLYVGTLFLSSLTLIGISWRGHRRHELLHEDRVEVQKWLRRPLSVYTAAVLGLSLALSPFFPDTALYVLLLLLLEGIVERLITRARGVPTPDKV